MPVAENAVHYLEIVTPDVQTTADFYANAYGWRFQPAAPELGATIALEPMEIPGRGQVAIYFLGGIEQGLWQVP